jgi:hypothetical protein
MKQSDLGESLNPNARPILKKFFFNSYKEWCCFLEGKSSNKIGTDQYLKKTLFYKLVLGFQGQTKIT